MCFVAAQFFGKPLDTVLIERENKKEVFPALRKGCKSEQPLGQGFL